MKPILFCSLFLIAVSVANAQSRQDSSGIKKSVINNVQMPVKPNIQLPVKIVGGIQRSSSGTPSSASPTNTPNGTNTTTTVPTTPSTVTNSGGQQYSTPPPNVSGPPAPAKTDADYYLSVVKVTIKTGRDNKEYPSKVYITVCTGAQKLKTLSTHGFRLTGYTNELKVNSTENLFIEKSYGYSTTENSLAAYKQNGVKFLLQYEGFSAFDAWKIESISLTLEFKDAAGNPSPSMGIKTILFPNADLWMDGFDKIYTYYKTDTYFNVMPVRQVGTMGDLIE